MAEDSGDSAAVTAAGNGIGIWKMANLCLSHPNQPVNTRPNLRLLRECFRQNRFILNTAMWVRLTPNEFIQFYGYGRSYMLCMLVGNTHFHSSLPHSPFDSLVILLLPVGRHHCHNDTPQKIQHQTKKKKSNSAIKYISTFHQRSDGEKNGMRNKRIGMQDEQQRK